MAQAAPPLYTITKLDLGSLVVNGGVVCGGINNSGQVVGYFDNTEMSIHAFLYSGGVMSNLGTMGRTQSGAVGINNSGQVVGLWSTRKSKLPQCSHCETAEIFNKIGMIGE